MQLGRASFVSAVATFGGGFAGAVSSTVLGIPHFPSIIAALSAITACLTAVNVVVVKPLLRYNHRQDGAIRDLEDGLQDVRLILARILGRLGMPPEEGPPPGS